jgi:hypothetical protein
MHRRTLLVISSLSPLASLGQMRPVARLAVFADGRVTLDGQPLQASKLDESFALLKQRNGMVWYYRQNAEAEPHPNAMSAIQLVVKHQLPVSLSTKPDFSDYVDESGQVKPRK